jgi:hypothetical protein
MEKYSTPVLVQDEEIIWVVGHRISEKVRVGTPGDDTWRIRLKPLAEGGTPKG